MSEEITENTEKTGEKLGQFQKGNDPRRNLEGRPKGKKNYETEMEEAIKEYAKLNNKTPEDIKLMIYMRGAGDALKGDYNFYRDWMDRTHGKPLQRIDQAVSGELQIKENSQDLDLLAEEVSKRLKEKKLNDTQYAK